MPDDQPPQPDPTSTPDTPPVEPSTSLDAEPFTQAQQVKVGQLLSKARQQAREQALKEQPGKAPTPGPKPAPEDPMAAMQARLEATELKLALTEATAGLRLTGPQKDTLRVLMQVEKPADPEAWAKGKAELLGWASAATTNHGGGESSPQSASARPQPPPGPPASDGGAPGAPANYQRTNNVLAWTPSDVDRIKAEKGLAAGRRYIREQMMSSLNGAQLIFPRRG